MHSELSRRSQAARADRLFFRRAYRILLSFFGFSCVLLILLNISSAAFVLVIHRQVLANKGDLQDTTHSSSRGPQISPQARRASQGIGAEDQVSKAEQRVAALRKVELEHLVVSRLGCQARSTGRRCSLSAMASRKLAHALTLFALFATNR